MDKNKQTLSEKKVETFAKISSSNKENLNMRVTRLRMLFQSKFTIVLVVLVIFTAGLLGYKNYQQYNAQKMAIKKTVTKQQVLVRRSKIPNVIVNATTAKAIDVKTGKVIQAARVFSLNDRIIYLALDLDNAKLNTYIDYVRYLNGRYVDHGNVKIAKDATSNITFNWTNVRPLGSVGDGKWKIATYTNGVLEKRVTYVVSKNQVSYVYPEELLTSSDPQHELNRTLALLNQSN